jgi:phosphatidylserine decarboxylase
MHKFSNSDSPSHTAFPVASAGYPFIFTSVFVTIVFALLGLTTLTLIGLASSLFICYFFRDPDRVVPNFKGAVISPADGKVISAGPVGSSRFYEGSCIKVSIFMSIFNVHVNRIPYEGHVKTVSYYPGKFFSANLDKASKDNEHNAVTLETEEGQTICTVQIAGLIARRIICKIQEGDIVARGQRFGLICFGSRLDVYLPPDTNLKVTVGDRVKAGTSVLGDLT